MPKLFFIICLLFSSFFTALIEASNGFSFCNRVGFLFFFYLSLSKIVWSILNPPYLVFIDSNVDEAALL